MRRTIREEHESFRKWTTRAIDKLSEALGRQPKDQEILDIVTEGSNERCIRYMNEKGFEDLPSLLEKMDRWDQKEGSRNLQRKRPNPTFTPREEGDRKRRRVLDLCPWCSQGGHTEDGCRNPKYCNLCAEDTHPRRDCVTYRNRKAAEKEAMLEAGAKAKVESLQAVPAPQDPIVLDFPAKMRGRGRKRGKPPKPAPVAFAGVGELEESRAWWGRERAQWRSLDQLSYGPFDPFQDGKCTRCGDTSHDGTSCPNRGETCTHCRKKGHMLARCFQLQKELRQKPDAAQRAPLARGPRHYQQPPQWSQMQMVPQGYQHPSYQMGGGGQAPLSDPMPQAFRQAYQMIQPAYPPQGVYAVQPMGHPRGQPQGQQQLSNPLPKEVKEESMVMAVCNEMRTHMQQSPDAETRRKRSESLMKTLFKAFTKNDIADPNLA
jgi:hypothetical protein